MYWNNRKYDQKLQRGTIVATLFLIFYAGAGSAYSAPYWIFFKDKGFATYAQIDSALSATESNLTSRAYHRRSKLNKMSLVDEFDLPVHTPYINQISKITQKHPRHASRWLNAVSIDASKDELATIAELPFVTNIRAVRTFNRPSDDLDNTELPLEEELPRRDPELDYGTSLRQNTFINAPELHERGYFGRGVLIGVADAGFDNLDHNCFGRLDLIDAWDFVNGDDNVANEDDRGDGSHGTKTLSIIAGWDPGRLIGIAPEASFVLAKTENTEEERQVEEDNLVAAIEWMDSLGVDIVSISLTYSNWYEYEDLDGDHAITSIAADRAAAVGMVIVVAMGNSGRAQYPGSKMGSPADADSVISVGATNRDSSRATFSSQGPTADGRIKPDLVSYGSSVKFASSRNDNDYGAGSGTSFSTPAIAGLCALLIQADSYLTPIEVRDLLRSSADNREEPDTLLGWGIPDGLSALNSIEQQVVDLHIPLRRGWSTISHNFTSTTVLNIANAFNPIIERDNLILVKNEHGNFFSPRNNFDGIGLWSSLEGYQVHLSDDDTLSLRGNLISTIVPVPVSNGWNLIAYKPNYRLSAEAAFSSLVNTNSLTIVKNHSGQFYHPRFNFNNMEPLEPGYGYHIKVSEDAELIYPRLRIAENGEFDQQDQRNTPTFFPLPDPQATCMNLLIYAGSNVSDGDEIGFYDASRTLIGAGIFENGLCGVAIWGEEIDVFPEVVVYQRDEKAGEVITPEVAWIEGERSFVPGGFGAISIDLPDSAQPNQHALTTTVTPNPFNDSFRLQYSFPTGETVTASLYDMNGRIVAQQSTISQSGMGALYFSSDNWASGSYLLKVTSGEVTKFLFAHHVK